MGRAQHDRENFLKALLLKDPGDKLWYSEILPTDQPLSTHTTFDLEDATRLATMAKLKAGRLVREAADSCLQFWGGMGFMEESLISRIYRDMRLPSIGGGADEVMLQILSKFMGTFPKKD